MPIKGLTDQVRLPRLGKIRLGLRVEGGDTTYPRPVDYFVCPDPVRQVYGQRPKELRVLFPIEDDTKWAAQFYLCYSHTRGLVCKGDGERATALTDERTGSLASRSSRETALKEIDCNPAVCPRYGQQCRRVMNLQFLLPDVPGLGVWQLDTSSYWSISNINNSIQLVRRTCGRVSMIPLFLRLQPRKVQPNGLKKTVYTITLATPLTLLEILKYAQLPPARVLLPAPDTEPPDDLFPLQSPDRAGKASGGLPPVAAVEITAVDDLFEACYRQYAMSQAQVLEALRLSYKEQIADPRQAWRVISQLKEGT